MQAEPTEPKRRGAIGWAQRLRRVNGRDIERYAACGGTLRVIACIEDRDVIETILAHRRRRIHALRVRAVLRAPAPRPKRMGRTAAPRRPPRLSADALRGAPLTLRPGPTPPAPRTAPSRRLGPNPRAPRRSEQGAAPLGAIHPTFASPIAPCEATAWPRGARQPLPFALNGAPQHYDGSSRPGQNALYLSCTPPSTSRIGSHPGARQGRLFGTDSVNPRRHKVPTTPRTAPIVEILTPRSVKVRPPGLEAPIGVALRFEHVNRVLILSGLKGPPPCAGDRLLECETCR